MPPDYSHWLTTSLHKSSISEMGDRFGHSRQGPKRGGLLCLFLWGGAGSSSNTMSPQQRPTTPYHVWYADPSSRLATIDMGQKWGLCPLISRGAGSPCNTMWPEPRPTFIPSGILIHATVWPQYTKVTERQDRTHNLLIA